MYNEELSRSYFSFRGGLNTKDSPVEVPETDLLDVRNFHYDRIGGLIKRTGYKKITASAIDGGSAIMGLFDARFNNATNDQYIVACTTSGKIFTVTRSTGAVSAALATGFTTGKRWTAAMHNGVTLVLVNGADAPQKMTSAAGVPTVAALGGAPPTAPAFVEVHNNQVWIGGRTAAPLRLDASDTGAPETWAGGASGNITVAPQYGQGATGLKSWFGRLVVGLEHETWQMTGTAFTGAGAYALTRVSEWIGTASHRTIQQVATSPIFLSYKGFHDLVGLPTGFADVNEKYRSVKIEPTIRDLTATGFNQAHSVNYRRRNWYATAVPDSGASVPNIFLVLDYNLGAWTIFDLPTSRTCQAQCVYRNANVEEWLIGLDDGHIYQMDSSQLHDDGTSIIARYRWITALGDPHHEKKWRKLYFLGEYNANATLSWSTQYEFGTYGSDSGTVQFKTSSGTFKTIGVSFRVGVDPIGAPSAVPVGISLGGLGRFLTVRVDNSDQQSVRIYGHTVVAGVPRPVPPSA